MNYKTIFFFIVTQRAKVQKTLIQTLFSFSSSFLKQSLRLLRKNKYKKLNL